MNERSPQNPPEQAHESNFDDVPDPHLREALTRYKIVGDAYQAPVFSKIVGRHALEVVREVRLENNLPIVNNDTEVLFLERMTQWMRNSNLPVFSQINDNLVKPSRVQDVNGGLLQVVAWWDILERTTNATQGEKVSTIPKELTMEMGLRLGDNYLVDFLGLDKNGENPFLNVARETKRDIDHTVDPKRIIPYVGPSTHRTLKEWDVEKINNILAESSDISGEEFINILDVVFTQMEFIRAAFSGSLDAFIPSRLINYKFSKTMVLIGQRDLKDMDTCISNLSQRDPRIKNIDHLFNVARIHAKEQGYKEVVVGYLRDQDDIDKESSESVD